MSKREPVNGNLFHQEVVLQYELQNFKSDAVTVDIQEDMNRLRDELCGKKEREVQWEIVQDGTSNQAQIERKDWRTAIFHVPLAAAPKGEAKVAPVTVAVHLFLRNEW